jgi:hypothetical protein
MSDGTLLAVISVGLIVTASVIAFGRSMLGKKQESKKTQSLFQ